MRFQIDVSKMKTPRDGLTQGCLGEIFHFMSKCLSRTYSMTVNMI